MKKSILLLLVVLSANAYAQDLGQLMHYQKKCVSCLSLAGELYNSQKFTIYLPDSVYSGGTISVKKVDQRSFKVNRAIFAFDSLEIVKVTFYVSGKKNIARFDEWIATQMIADPNGGYDAQLLIQNKRPISYATTRKKRLIAVAIAVR